MGAARTETVGGDSFEHFNIYGRMVCVQMLMHTWEVWEDGKINEAQEQEEEDNEDIYQLGEETDIYEGATCNCNGKPWQWRRNAV